LPTACNYSSVNNLRKKRIQKQADSDLLETAARCLLCRSFATDHYCNAGGPGLGKSLRLREIIILPVGLTQFGGGSALAKLGEGEGRRVDIRAVVRRLYNWKMRFSNASEGSVSPVVGLFYTNQ
jgi:hypothetical protein